MAGSWTPHGGAGTWEVGAHDLDVAPGVPTIQARRVRSGRTDRLPPTGFHQDKLSSYQFYPSVRGARGQAPRGTAESPAAQAHGDPCLPPKEVDLTRSAPHVNHYKEVDFFPLTEPEDLRQLGLRELVGVEIGHCEVCAARADHRRGCWGRRSPGKCLASTDPAASRCPRVGRCVGGRPPGLAGGGCVRQGSGWGRIQECRGCSDRASKLGNVGFDRVLA